MAKNIWKTSDIRISRDSVGYYDAEHKYQGVLFETEDFASRSEARRVAVEILGAKKADDGVRLSNFATF